MLVLVITGKGIFWDGRSPNAPFGLGIYSESEATGDLFIQVFAHPLSEFSSKMWICLPLGKFPNFQMKKTTESPWCLTLFDSLLVWVMGTKGMGRARQQLAPTSFQEIREVQDPFTTCASHVLAPNHRELHFPHTLLLLAPWQALPMGGTGWRLKGGKRTQSGYSSLHPPTLFRRQQLHLLHDSGVKSRSWHRGSGHTSSSFVPFPGGVVVTELPKAVKNSY